MFFRNYKQKYLKNQRIKKGNSARKGVFNYDFVEMLYFNDPLWVRIQLIILKKGSHWG